MLDAIIKSLECELNKEADYFVHEGISRTCSFPCLRIFSDVVLYLPYPIDFKSTQSMAGSVAFVDVYVLHEGHYLETSSGKECNIE